MFIKKLSSQKESREERGFTTTALVLVTLAIFSGILVATSNRSWFGTKSVARQGLANGAREAAEAGTAIIMEDLNSNYPYFLVKDNADWVIDSNINQTLCDGNSTGPGPTTSGDVGNSGTFELVKYKFNGNPIYGGVAILQVRGTASTSSNPESAIAVVEQKFEIIPKICSKSGKFSCPGLFAQTGRMRNNDVRGVGANVQFAQPSSFCSSLPTSYQSYTRDDKECALGGTNGMVVEGEIFIGPAELPPVPTAPANLSGVIGAEITSSETIDSGSPPSYCIIEDNITHCKITSINITGGENLIVDTSSGNRVQIYVSGDVDVRGNAFIEQQPSTEDAAKVGIFGNPIDSDNTNDQEVDVRGRARITNMFLYFPDGKVGIRGGGGASATSSCDPATGECLGGNIHGAVWAKEWGRSGSNVAEVTVPGNWCEQVEEYYNGFRVGNKSFVARGPVDFRVLNLNTLNNQE